ncbi:amphi-Trp domain-containing protein [Candidatus Bipolaricaulota bacterium]|nr:amphi-Trp domain-containing protein [Candidatus Bipolaricaulota bacterium]
MAELPSSNEEFDSEVEYESDVTKEDLVSFLEEIVGQLKEENAITVSMVGTKARFPFEEPINLEIETDYNKRLGKRELEVEMEFRESDNQTR